jgi:acyl-[acyl carrier protein]--UDP-N-acetylglucosamine O-acyltransferase
VPIWSCDLVRNTSEYLTFNEISSGVRRELTSCTNGGNITFGGNILFDGYIMVGGYIMFGGHSMSGDSILWLSGFIIVGGYIMLDGYSVWRVHYDICLYSFFSLNVSSQQTIGTV